MDLLIYLFYLLQCLPEIDFCKTQPFYIWKKRRRL